MRCIHLLALAPFAGYLLLADAAIDKHVDSLQKSQSLKMTLSVNRIGGSTEEDTLTLTRPGKFRWETPSKLVVSDGKVVWSYDKVAKTYIKKEYTEGAATEALGADAVWVWSAFFDNKFAEGITSVVKGSSHKVRDVPVTDYLVTRKDKREFTLLIDDALGVARGIRFTTDDNGQKTETIASAKDLALGTEALGDDLFAWTPPADAVDAAEAARQRAANALHFADIKPIFEKNCIGCHSGPGAKDGVDLSSYQSVMDSRVVRAGNAETSRLVKVIRSGKMPPAGPLPKGDVDQVAKWIADGALE